MIYATTDEAIELRKRLVTQQREAESALAAQDTKSLIERLRDAHTQQYAELGLTFDQVWSKPTKAVSSLQSGQGGSGRKPRGSVQPTHKWTAPDGNTYYCNRHSKGKRPEWLSIYAKQVKTKDNAVRYEVMQPFKTADRQDWLESLKRK